MVWSQSRDPINRWIYYSKLLANGLEKMRTFKIIWAMGDEPGLVPVLGLPLMRYRALVFALSAGLARLAGGLIAIDVGIDPHMGMSYLLIAAVAVLVGGIDQYSGYYCRAANPIALQTPCRDLLGLGKIGP